MTAKEIFESIDLSQLPKEAADKFRKVEKATKGFSVESEKVNTFMRGAYKKIKETKPTALKNLKVEEKIIKKEVKNGKTTEVVENLEYKVEGTKKVSKKTPTPSKPKRKGETAMERARKIRKKDSSGKLEPWKDALALAQKELKQESTKAKKDAEKVVSTTSQALKSLEKMIQNDPKLKGYPRTYGNQSKRIDANKDAKIKAKPAGKRVSKKGHKNQYGESKGGRVYWENRDNRSDRYAPNFPNKVFLEMGGETDDLGFPTGHTFLVVEVSPDGTKNLIKSTTDYMTALMSSAVTRGRKTNKSNRVVIVDKEDKKVIHEAFEAGGEITITPTQIVNNPDYLVGTTTMTELFEAGGVTAYQEGGEVFITPYPLTNAGSADYVAGSNTMSNMFAKGGRLLTTRERYILELKGLAKGLRPAAIDKFIDENKLTDEEILNLVIGLGRKQITQSDFVTAIVGNKNNEKFKNLMAFIKSDKALRMEKGGFIAIYNEKKVEIEADTLLEAKKKAIQELKVPKSKQGLLSVMSNASMANQDFRFMESGGKLPKTIKYYGVNEVKEYRLKNGDKIDPSKTFVDSGVYVSATKTMKPKEKEFQQKLEFEKGGVVEKYVVIKGSKSKTFNDKKSAKAYKNKNGGEYAEIINGRLMVYKDQTILAKGGATNWKGEKINWKEDYIYIPRFEIEEVELDNGKVIKGDYVVSGLYLPKSDRTKQLEKEMKARMKKMGKGGVVHLYFGGEQPDEVMEAANENEAASIAMKMGAEHYDFVAQMETGGTIVSADPSSAMEDLNQTYGYESVYEKGGRLGFDGLAKKVAKRYEGKAVKPKYQEEYGKTYSKEEAMEVGRKVAAKVYGQQQAKMEMGGEITQPYSLINSGSADYVAGSNTMSNMFAKGGSLDGHGLQLGDKIVKDLGSILQVATKDGGMVYVDLASGYRGSDMPLPFEKGGAVGGINIPDIAKKFGKTTADVMKQVEIGAKHEMENTWSHTDPKKARKIALDHLSGDLDYYTKLNKLGL
tara:strand:+ start:16066 stop:19092 length:3027 start_codon:yes stop_codon:yes gene_type:complete